MKRKNIYIVLLLTLWFGILQLYWANVVSIETSINDGDFIKSWWYNTLRERVLNINSAWDWKNIWIGKAPSSSYKLDVNWNVNSSWYCIDWDCKTSWAPNTPWTISWNNIYYTWGNVGIGTNDPTSNLHINWNMQIDNWSINLLRPETTGWWARGISYFNPSNLTTELAWFWLLGTWPEVNKIYMGFWDNPWWTTTWINILNNWNVGIGVANPSYKLDMIWVARINNWAAYDVWLQWWPDTTWWWRNLAILWVKSTDQLIINHANEYAWWTNIMSTVYGNAFVYNSDKKLKTNIKKLNNYFDILKIDPKRFDWKDKKNKKNPIGDIWVIAQDIEKYFPEFVEKDPEWIKSVNYPKLVVPLIWVVKDQQTQIKKQNKEIENLKNEINNIKKLLINK